MWIDKTFQIPHNHHYINICVNHKDQSLCIESSDVCCLIEDVKYYGINTVRVVPSLSSLSLFSLEANKTKKYRSLLP